MRAQARRERLGRRYRLIADTITYGRTVLGLATAGGILAGSAFLPRQLQHRSLGLAGTMAAFGMADKADGYFARKAVEHGIPITDIDKKKDPFQDKVFFHAVLGSVAVREAVDGNRPYAAALGASFCFTALRNRKMNHSRNNAVEGAEVSAISINKWKTGVENLSHTLATSPLPEQPVGQVVVAFSYVVSNVLGYIGYRRADEMHRTPPPLRQAA